MNKLTKTLLILPIIALTAVGCGETKPESRIETVDFNGQEMSVNCTDKTVFDFEQQKWITRSESIEGVTPGYEDLSLMFFDGVYGRACGN